MVDARDLRSRVLYERVGSTPSLGTRGLAQLARARGLGPRGRRFKSSVPDSILMFEPK